MMEVRVPFLLLPPKIALKVSRLFMGIAASAAKSFPTLQQELEKANLKTDAQQYLALCFVATSFLFVWLSILFVLLLAKIGNPFFGLVPVFFLCSIIFFTQIKYPKILAYKRIKKLDADLLAAISAMMIQLNSGVSLFEALVTISRQEFGEVSAEFKKAVAKINAGEPQIEALESMALRNPSPYFQRTLWQIINGMKEGASTTQVMNSVFKNLTEEQIIQIEKYGAQLSPLITFYMVGAIIFPALGVTFLIVMSSFIPIAPVILKIIFWGLLTFVVFFQIMFAGLIKTGRPSLLGEK